MNTKKTMWILAMTAIAAVGFILMVGTQRGQAAGPGDNATNQVEVKIDNFSFGPMTLTVAAGTTVTWTNNDDVPYVVTSDDNKMFKSKALDTDDRFSFTFTKPGTYNYYCAIHPKMVAKIVVQ